jgi:hypothetical protein
MAAWNMPFVGRVMILSNHIKKTLIAIPTVLIFQSLILLSDKTPDLLVSERFITLVMGSITQPEGKFFIFAIENLIYVFLFEILFGHYIYNELRYSSTYVFSRINNTNRWFLKKSLELGMYTVFYIFLYLGTMFLLAIYATGNSPDSTSFIVFMQLLMKLTFICFTGTLFINILSLYNGTVVSFLIVYAAQVLEVFFIMNIREIPFVNQYPDIIKWLPMNSLVINSYQYTSFNLFELFYSMTIVVISILLTLSLVKRTDLSLVKHN